jgi:hypothetical protein
MPNKDLLRGLADNPALMATVKDLLVKRFSTDSLASTDSDIVLGQMVRARLVGLKAIEEAFKEIEQFKTPPPSRPKVNRAL